MTTRVTRPQTPSEQRASTPMVSGVISATATSLVSDTVGLPSVDAGTAQRSASFTGNRPEGDRAGRLCAATGAASAVGADPDAGNDPQRGPQRLSRAHGGNTRSASPPLLAR